jgi:hypothetical protein
MLTNSYHVVAVGVWVGEPARSRVPIGVKLSRSIVLLRWRYPQLVVKDVWVEIKPFLIAIRMRKLQDLPWKQYVGLYG